MLKKYRFRRKFASGAALKVFRYFSKRRSASSLRAVCSSGAYALWLVADGVTRAVFLILYSCYSSIPSGGGSILSQFPLSYTRWDLSARRFVRFPLLRERQTTAETV